MRLFIAFITLLLVSAPGYAKDAARADLTIVDGSTKRVITGDDFRSLHLDSVEVVDPVYGRHKRYAGYWLSEIFALAGIHPDPKAVWTFTALDGYKAQIAVEDVLRTGVKAFVAVRDLDAPDDWEKIKQGKQWLSPGPYYLVWETPTGAPEEIKLPWPYQMVKISIDKAGDTQQELFPDDVARSQSVGSGYKIFKQNCLSCHSLNLQGGVVGPELNVPKNILEYEDRSFLKAFISDPGSFRARSKMPSFNKVLTAQELDDVLDYLSWMGKHKIQ